ncbi:MAG: glycogen synthase GlgA [Chloroflexota bacterium]|nr:MAG: glycogen synthase GlgA [Chloroflexota bacterium]
MSPSLKILFVSAEVVPFAKTGGLADIAGSLPKALAAYGHDVRVVMPRYARIQPERFGLKTILPALTVPVDDGMETASVMEARIGGDVPVYFVGLDKYFNREGIYGYPDDGERFVVFCRAILEMLKGLAWRPDVIHCHDWHTAIIPNWTKTLYRNDPFFRDVATVYTIHNLAYQGVFGFRILEIAGLDELGYVHHPETSDLNDVVDLMARGIVFADVVTTVSPRYAQEILTPEHGERLDPLLRERENRLFGVLNGVDYDEYDPAHDPYLDFNYTVDDLDRRVKNKQALQREAGLQEDPNIPLVGLISRLTDQKGFDILGAIFDHVLDLNVQFVLLGTGDQHYHSMLTRLAREHPTQLALFLTFNAPLAQKIYAGTDMFLMPSRFEPCGLGQMIAMRYGSIPIVRATGGLADTVDNYDPARETGTGFVFQRYEGHELFAALVRALENYRHRDAWRRLQQRCMRQDFSWRASAGKYVDLYWKAIEWQRIGDPRQTERALRPFSLARNP